MAISMDSFSKEFLKAMCKECILHCYIKGTWKYPWLLSVTEYLLYYAAVTGTCIWKFPWILLVNNFLICHIVVGYMEISTHGPFC